MSKENDIIFQTLKSITYPGKPDDLIRMLMSLCEAEGVDPRKKTMDIIQRGGKWNLEPNLGHYRLKALMSGEYHSTSEPEWGPIITHMGVQAPEWCKITVYRYNRLSGSIGAFPKTERLKSNMGSSPFWKTRAPEMLEKCAESQALRKAFADHIMAIPTSEEMEGSSEEMEGSLREIKHEPISLPVTPKAAVIDFHAAPKKVAQSNEPNDEIAFLESISRVDPVLPLKEAIPIIESRLKGEDKLVYKDPLTDEEKLMSVQEFGLFIREILVGIDSVSKYNLYTTIRETNKESFNALAKREPLQAMVLKDIFKEKSSAYDNNSI